MAPNQNNRISIWKFYSRCPAKTTYPAPYSSIDDPAQNRGVQLIHQPSLIKKIASDFESAFAISSAHKSAGKEAGTKQDCECPEKKRVVVYGQENLYNAAGMRPVPRTDTERKEASSRAVATAVNKEDDDSVRSDDNEGRFSDYISKVKRRMLRTVSTIGGTKPRASKDDKVKTYTNRFNNISLKK